MEQIGRVSGIYRYPVKSMGGERLEAAPVTFQGIPGDRVQAFIQGNSTSTFPWLTGRQVPSMLHYRARVTSKELGVEVVTPSGRTVAADDPELLAEIEALAGQPVHRLADYRGSFDVAPVTLIANASVAAIAEASGTTLDPLRFRMTFYLDTGDETPFIENAWVGRTVRIGENVRVVVTERDQRCVMTTLDYPDSTGSPKVLRAIAELNGACAGVYAVVVAQGEVREGDAAWLE